MILVASYCRVSTDQEDQANSFAAQQRYFREYIARQPDWELYAVYADEGVTGTSAHKRTQFMEMMEDARNGRFQLIITKEVSRFSRNTLDTLLYTRELRSLGIAVLFMNDGINTLQPDAELRLSIMGSIAQEESRKTSSRVKWGQTRQMERGVVFGRSMLGYDVKNGKMTVNPRGAEIVRLIYFKYGVEKKGSSTIARELMESGIPSFTGKQAWSGGQIVKILRNEKYAGDLIQKKTYTPDYLSHRKRINHGEEARIAMRDHHEAIIDRELWNTVQEELNRRNKKERYFSSARRYLFSGKIFCGSCGSCFVSRIKRRRDGTSYRRWSCLTAANEGTRRQDPLGREVGCSIGRMLRDDLALEMLRQVVASLDLDREQMADRLIALLLKGMRFAAHGKEILEEKLRSEIDHVVEKKHHSLAAFIEKDISREDMQMISARCDEQLDALRNRLERVQKQKIAMEDASESAAEIKKQVMEILYGKTDSELFFKTILKKMIVYQDAHVELQLNDYPAAWFFSLEPVGK